MYEVMDYLAAFGSIERIVKITTDDPQFKDSAIAEFTSGESIEFISASLPCQRISSNPDVTHHIQLLSEVYVADKSSNLTDSYLAELKGIAKLSGADFEKLLLDEVAKLQKSTKTQPESLAPDSPLPVKRVTDLIDLDPLRPQPYGLSPEHFTPPEVQKVVVEHVIKNSDPPSSYQGRVKLRPFPGKVPCPCSESDYDTWRSNVEFLLAYTTVSDKHTVRMIMESLLPPAAHIVKHLGPKASPHNYLCLLDSAYDTVDDGD